jgi:hypothetical protein
VRAVFARAAEAAGAVAEEVTAVGSVEGHGGALIHRQIAAIAGPASYLTHVKPPHQTGKARVPLA